MTPATPVARPETRYRAWFAMRAYHRFSNLTGRKPTSVTVYFGGADPVADFERVAPSRPITHPAPAVSLTVDPAWWTQRGRYLDADALAPYIDELVAAKARALGLLQLTSAIRQCPAPTGGCDL